MGLLSGKESKDDSGDGGVGDGEEDDDSRLSLLELALKLGGMVVNEVYYGLRGMVKRSGDDCGDRWDD